LQALAVAEGFAALLGNDAKVLWHKGVFGLSRANLEALESIMKSISLFW
jgi:hypothetical protein